MADGTESGATGAAAQPATSTMANAVQAQLLTSVQLPIIGASLGRGGSFAQAPANANPQMLQRGMRLATRQTGGSRGTVGTASPSTTFSEPYRCACRGR